MACQKLGQMVQKNEDISESVNSFDTGAIFRLRSGHDLSGNVLFLAMRFTKIPTDGKVSCMTPKLTKILKKCSLVSRNSIFPGPAGGSRTTRVHSPPDTNIHMTRRAFLSSRVIQAHGKLSSRWRVKNWGKWFRKMKMSQNL